MKWGGFDAGYFGIVRADGEKFKRIFFHQFPKVVLLEHNRPSRVPELKC